MRKFFSDVIHRALLGLTIRCAGRLFKYADIYVDGDDIAQGVIFTNDQGYFKHMTSYESKKAK